MNQQQTRVRFAPSPTGHLHVGGLRVALFNWLYARHTNGVYLLRIEDTDPERSQQIYTQSLLNALAWAGITSDEPVVIQSQRAERHKQVLQKMLSEGTAYYCFCSPHELQERLGASAATEGYSKYDQRCRTRQQEYTQGKSCIVRFKVPDIAHVVVHDIVHGPIIFDRDQLDDFVLMRSDGTFMYNFVVVVDDADMAITHVLRGDDHIPNTPKQLLLYNACSFTVPVFGHLPMILGSDGQRLSKRHAATAVIEYQKQGFLPDALCNYLVRLGWSHGDQEIFTRQELIEYFSLEHIGKKSSIFDVKKLEWLNSVYIKNSTAPELLAYSLNTLDALFLERLSLWTLEQVLALIDLYKERVKTVQELLQEVYALYYLSYELDEHEQTQWSIPKTQQLLYKFSQFLLEQEEFAAPALSERIKTWVASEGSKLSDVAQPVRKALTGKQASAGVFELLVLLGKQESNDRLQAFLKKLKKAE